MKLKLTLAILFLLLCMTLSFNGYAMTPQDIEEAAVSEHPCQDEDGKVVRCVLFVHDGKMYGAMFDEKGLKAVHDLEKMEELWRRKPGTTI